MKYWTSLFTWNTWQEFRDAGGNITGFREKQWSKVQQIKPGDILLCYLTGVSRYFAILEVTGEPYKDDSKVIWEEDVFPCRVPVRIVLSLEPEYAIPVVELGEQLSFFRNMSAPHSWTSRFRSSPTEVGQDDATVIIKALEEAKRNPVSRDFDRRKLERKVYGSPEAVTVTIPEDTEEPESTHEEIQRLLLDLGNQMGLDVWVASNDRSKFRDLPGLLDSLPIQFDAATNKTIGLIDVLWLLKGSNSIEAAFEIEHTTSIYSGLLRLSDLISMQPNIKIKLYIVAPDERREKVFTEINRPTFSRLRTPLSDICRFIPYSALKDTVGYPKDILAHLKPEFLEEIAEELKVED